MKLSPEDIEEFRKIWKKEFNEEITVDEASEAGSRLVELLWLLVEKKNDDQTNSAE